MYPPVLCSSNAFLSFFVTFPCPIDPTTSLPPLYSV